MNSGISYSQAFAEMEAAIAAGATLADLFKWMSGAYPRWFRAQVVAWHQLHRLIDQNEQDAMNEAVRKKSKK